MSRLKELLMNEEPELVAPGIYRIASAIVNAYMIGYPGEEWVLVDTGLPFSAGQIKQAAEEVYGLDAKPAAIVLTHGHFDHAGSVVELADFWQVPVYAHPDEFPFLTGKSPYPPADPTVGGLGGQMSRFYSNSPVDISKYLRPLPQDGSVPHRPLFKWIHTPGHTPGHISLFRERDRVLVAGDAVVTMDQHNAAGLMGKHTGLYGPPEYFTPDWIAALRSIDRLALLKPKVIATGHGKPLSYRGLSLDLVQFADKYMPPQDGRYIRQPAQFSEHGITSLPPKASDPLPKVAAGIGVGILGLFAAWQAMRHNGHDKPKKAKKLVRAKTKRTSIELPWNKQMRKPIRKERFKPVSFNLAKRKKYSEE